jgi:hypothetical protein
MTEYNKVSDGGYEVDFEVSGSLYSVWVHSEADAEAICELAADVDYWQEIAQDYEDRLDDVRRTIGRSTNALRP